MTAQFYDNPLTISYGGVLNWDDGDEATAIQRPLNKKFARIEEIHVMVTEAFDATTTAAFLRIGTASDNDKFAELSMGTAADTDGYGTNDDTDAIKAAGKFIDLDRDGDSGASLDQLEVNFVESTGGVPSGIGWFTICISWF